MKEEQKPDSKAFVSNLAKPMPIAKKISFFVKNNALKLVTRKNCCGHPGEPGC